MRILIPVLGFAPQGGYRVLSELANAWIRLGHECTFLVPATSRDPYFPTTARVVRCSRSGLVENVASKRKFKGIDNVLSLFIGLRKIGHNYDVILANHCLTSWPVRWANCGKALKAYYIQAYEPDYYPLLRHPTKHILSRISYLLDLRQISNSASYKGRGINPIDIIPPGIDLSVFTKKDTQTMPKQKSEVVMGTIGRTEPYKGTSTALAAYRELRKNNPKLRMKIGFGNVEPADDIEIVDIRGDHALAAFYRSLDLLIVSCRSQHGAPHYPLIEAMASGTPVVQTGYYPGDETNSWVSSNPSVEAVMEALQDFLSAPQQGVATKVAAARDVVERELGWDQVAQRFIPCFQMESGQS